MTSALPWTFHRAGSLHNTSWVTTALTLGSSTARTRSKSEDMDGISSRTCPASWELVGVFTPFSYQQVHAATTKKIPKTSMGSSGRCFTKAAWTCVHLTKNLKEVAETSQENRTRCSETVEQRPLTRSSRRSSWHRWREPLCACLVGAFTFALGSTAWQFSPPGF